MTPDDRIARLEESVAYLERHVTQQDRVLLELTGDLGRLRKALATLHDRLAQSSPSEPGPAPAERPRHYGPGR